MSEFTQDDIDNISLLHVWLVELSEEDPERTDLVGCYKTLEKVLENFEEEVIFAIPDLGVGLFSHTEDGSIHYDYEEDEYDLC